MSVVEATVLGAVQGLTEFVPISSSGHLVLVPAMFGWDAPSLAFDVLLHVPSLLVLLVYFRADLADLGRRVVTRDPSGLRLLGLLAVGTVPSVIAALALDEAIEASFQDARATGFQLIANGVLLLGAEGLARLRSDTGSWTIGSLRGRHAFLIGVGQALAIAPAISRSGTTIGAGLIVGLKREEAARFAFLLLIPAIVGASVFEAPALVGQRLDLLPAIFGFGASLLTSYVAVWGLMRYLRTHGLGLFAGYCLVAGLGYSLLG